jgi:hypothetical protein
MSSLFLSQPAIILKKIRFLGAVDSGRVRYESLGSDGLINAPRPLTHTGCRAAAQED